MEYSSLDLHGLNLLYQVQESVCNGAEENLHLIKDKLSPEYQEAMSVLTYHRMNFERIKQEISSRRQEKLVYSIQDVYKFGGQMDYYLVFEFYPTSDAYIKYGESVHGHVIFRRQERPRLERE